MTGTFSRPALAVTAIAAVVAALPGAARAQAQGVSTAIGTVTMSITSQCGITGANVSLGAYRTTDSWATVAAAMGSVAGATYTAGSLGQDYLNFGSVTCDAGVPYSLQVQGTGESGVIRMAVNGKTAILEPHVKRVGQATLADGAFPGVGPTLNVEGAYNTGDGAPQAILGNALIRANHGTATALLTDSLGVAGPHVDALTYTLTF